MQPDLTSSVIQAWMIVTISLFVLAVVERQIRKYGVPKIRFRKRKS
jgi:hypothetical protein